MNRRELEQYLISSARKYGIKSAKIADGIIEQTRPSDVLPEIYSDFRTVVEDGIRFMLSGFSLDRLISIAVGQLLLDDSVSIEERLIFLAREVPTLHKLGQIIARNRNVDPRFRRWLVRLENDRPGSDAVEIRKLIEEEMADHIKILSIDIGKNILSEASVGAVTPFTWIEPGSEEKIKGVFKIIKPNIREHLTEELNLLDELAVYFSENRRKYPLENFRFIDIFRDIRNALFDEIDLTGEQSNLKKASHFYGHKPSKTASIPSVLSFSTKNVTAMEHMNGGKITDVFDESSVRIKSARALFKAVIWRPLFSRKSVTIFHGDPHAGNIFGQRLPGTDTIKIILLDWSQAGYLTRSQRTEIIKLTMGIAMKDNELIADSIENLSSDAGSGNSDKIRQCVKTITDAPDYRSKRLLEKAFTMIDRLSFKGIRFPKDLLLFRKAFFTLEGVLAELDPFYNIDRYMIDAVKDLIIEESPKRWLNFLAPVFESSEEYKTMLSNKDIHFLFYRLMISKMRNGMDYFSNIAAKHVSFAARIQYALFVETPKALFF